MDALERSILMELVYSGAMHWQLTLSELHERLGGNLGEIASRLDALVASGAVLLAHGLYSAGWRIADVATNLALNRIAQQKECTQKWKRMLRRAWWLQAVPYVRMLAASGSLALGNTDADSDWDMFVIVKSGRLYTARAGLLFAAWLMGRLRTKRMRTAPDKFCFNHIITTDGLAIRHRSIFTAHALAELIPMWDPYEYSKKLREANRWISDWVSLFGDKKLVRRAVKRSRILGAMRKCAEFILNTFIGWLAEKALSRWMKKRIAREPITHEHGGRIVADERELEFHPHSFEAVVLSRYNAALTRLGLGQYIEHDSGLTR